MKLAATNYHPLGTAHLLLLRADHVHTFRWQGPTAMCACEPHVRRPSWLAYVVALLGDVAQLGVTRRPKGELEFVVEELHQLDGRAGRRAVAAAALKVHLAAFGEDEHLLVPHQRMECAIIRLVPPRVLAGLDRGLLQRAQPIRPQEDTRRAGGVRQVFDDRRARADFAARVVVIGLTAAVEPQGRVATCFGQERLDHGRMCQHIVGLGDRDVHTAAAAGRLALAEIATLHFAALQQVGIDPQVIDEQFFVHRG